jgi:monomeric sarcosine oxidase
LAQVADFDHIIVGTGAIGSGAAYWLARRTSGRVLVLEQFELGHDRGASEDHSRIIRHSYPEVENARLTRPAYNAWAEVEAAAGLPLVIRTGGLDLGDPAALEDCAAAMTETGAGFEWLDAEEVRRRYPQFVIPDDALALYQPEAGVLDVRAACAAHLALARAAGATIVSHERVTAIEETGSHVTVTTAAGDRHRASSVSVAAGRWTNRVLAHTGWQVPLRYQHQQVHYFAGPRLRDFAVGRFPVWIWQADACFYGLPVYGLPSVKAAEDLGGRWIDLRDDPEPVDETMRARLERFLTAYLPGVLGPELMTRVCAYDLTPDRGFVLDAVPGHSRVFVALGAGHGAKFGSLMGRVLADLVLDGGTSVPIEPFRADRPALTDPEFVPIVPSWNEPVAA